MATGCPICLEDLASAEHVFRFANCDHEIHWRCLARQFPLNCCPVCRELWTEADTCRCRELTETAGFVAASPSPVRPARVPLQLGLPMDLMPLCCQHLDGITFVRLPERCMHYHSAVHPTSRHQTDTWQCNGCGRDVDRFSLEQIPASFHFW